MSAAAKGPTVLVVEDEALLLFAIADDLRDAGYEVFEATGADEAIRVLMAHPEIRILFTDIDMPGSMNGLKLSAVVRDRWPPVQIIVTSGKTRPGPEMMPAGSLFVAKPYSPTGVIAAMGRMLG